MAKDKGYWRSADEGVADWIKLTSSVFPQTTIITATESGFTLIDKTPTKPSTAGSIPMRNISSASPSHTALGNGNLRPFDEISASIARVRGKGENSQSAPYSLAELESHIKNKQQENKQTEMRKGCT